MKKEMIKKIILFMLISSVAFGKLNKMPQFKEYVGISREVIIKDFGKPDIVENFGEDGDVIVFIKDDYNFENFFIDGKTNKCTRHFVYYGVQLLEEKRKELKKLYGEPGKDDLGRAIYKNKIRLSELYPNEDNADFIKDKKVMSFMVMEYLNKNFIVNK